MNVVDVCQLLSESTFLDEVQHKIGSCVDSILPVEESILFRSLVFKHKPIVSKDSLGELDTNRSEVFCSFDAESLYQLVLLGKAPNFDKSLIIHISCDKIILRRTHWRVNTKVCLKL